MRLELRIGEHAYHTRLLQPPDLDALQQLFERGAEYFNAMTGRGPAPDEARRAYVAGPPTKQVSDKRIIGVFADTQLVAVIDALTDWPDLGTWTMGLLLVDPAQRGAGLGSAFLTAYEGWAAHEGAIRLRTALVGSHKLGVRFLERAGYTRVDMHDAGRGSSGPQPVLFFEKPVPRAQPGVG